MEVLERGKLKVNPVLKVGGWAIHDLYYLTTQYLIHRYATLQSSTFHCPLHHWIGRALLQGKF